MDISRVVDRRTDLAVELGFLRGHLCLGGVERGRPDDAGGDGGGGHGGWAFRWSWREGKDGAGVFKAGAELKWTVMVRWQPADMYFVAVHGASRPRAVGANWRIAADHWPRHFACSYVSTNVYGRSQSPRDDLWAHILPTLSPPECCNGPERIPIDRGGCGIPKHGRADRGAMRSSPENVSPISDRPAAQARAGPPRLIVLRLDLSPTESVGATSICRRSYKNEEEAPTAPAQPRQRR